jgi:hypothetical protein
VGDHEGEMHEETWVTVRSVEQEQWYVARTPCSCGGRFRSVSRQLTAGPRGAGDIVVAACGRCGSQKDFRFDISLFYDEEGRELQAAASAIATIDSRTRRKILRALGSPMKRAVDYVRELSAEGDSLALDFLEDELRAARARQAIAEKVAS